MTNELNPQGEATFANFYDPLYEVVAFKKKWWVDDKASLTEEHFRSVISTYEFNRLSFLRQEGVTWLDFPSAGHSRYSAALGCWYLADWATDNILVVEKGSSYSVRLGRRLSSIGWLEEFRLAALIHDIGHFPFTGALENNDRLKEEFYARHGLPLDHTEFTFNLITRAKDDAKAASVQELHRHYVRDCVADKPDDSLFLSNVLEKVCPDCIHADKIAYLLSPGAEEPSDVEGKDVSFLRLVRELIVGTINLGRLDRFNRVARFVQGPAGALPVQTILTKLTLVEDPNGGEGSLRLTPDGARYTYHVLYQARNALTRDVFQVPTNLAWELMLNRAICKQWDWDKEHGVRTLQDYLPFLEDGELFAHLRDSKLPEVRDIVYRIRQRIPYHFVGSLRVPDRVSRKHVLGIFQEDRFRDRIFVRLTKSFGRTSPSPWLSLDRLTVERGSRVLRLSEIKEEEPIIKLLGDTEEKQRGNLWLYTEDRLGDKEQEELVATAVKTLRAERL